MDELLALVALLIFTAFIVVTLLFVFHVIVILALVAGLWLLPSIIVGFIRGRSPHAG